MHCESSKIDKKRSSSCIKVPPQLDEGTVRAIKGATDGLDAAISSVMSTNGILSIFVGASAQELMGMLR